MGWFFRSGRSPMVGCFERYYNVRELLFGRFHVDWKTAFAISWCKFAGFLVQASFISIASPQVGDRLPTEGVLNIT
jgi:hypothetical protein